MMSEFVCMDWDLQAIVRGCNFVASTSIMENPESWFSSSSLQQDVALKLPDICETTTILNELEELYKPFYPQTVLTSPISVPAEVKKPKKMGKQELLSGSVNGADNTDDAAKPKRGKNQQKRVVKQVPAEGLSSDMWAWRKYGQKPIKGSPYPRSYYRCSSSKGCLARKQVERSSIDQEMFTITYTAEHNHTHPTRRSSLAGSTRNKSSIRKGTATNEPHDQQTDFSPITPLVTSIEDEFMHQESIKKEEHVSEDGEENEIVNMPDLIFNDELFPSLEDLEGLLLDQFSESFPDKSWFTDEPATISGGC